MNTQIKIWGGETSTPFLFKISKGENKMKKLSDTGGFTFIEIMIVVFLIGMLSSIAVYNYIQVRHDAQGRICTSNLRNIDHAKERWAFATKADNSDTPTESDLELYLRNGYPDCPGGGTYTIGTMNDLPTCSLAEAPNFHNIP